MLPRPALFSAILLLFVCASHGAPPTSQVPPAPSVETTTDKERIRTVLAQTTRARERIRTAVVDVEWSNSRFFDPTMIGSPRGLNIPAGQLQNVRRGTWTYKGSSLRMDMTETREVSGKGYRETTCVQAVRNDSYAAQHSTAIPDMLYMAKYSSALAMDDFARQFSKMYEGPDIRHYGFGVGGGFDLKDELDLHPGVIDWEMRTEQSDEGLVYVVTRLGVADERGKRERTEYTIDGDRDFLIERVRVTATDGSVPYDLRVELQQLDDGHWFPKSVFEKTFEGSILKATVHSAKINTPISDSEFLIESMHFDRPVERMYVHTSFQGAEHYQLVDGQWMESGRR